ncbi:MAG: MazG nucleotide pyrophosphohydrolase domain-containing protein [Thermoplasmata archaeon]
MDLKSFSEEMARKFLDNDRQMGDLFLFSCLAEEVGEAAKALRKKDYNNLEEELADIIFITVSLANFHGLNLEKVLLEKYLKPTAEDISKRWNDVSWKKTSGK